MICDDMCLHCVLGTCWHATCYKDIGQFYDKGCLASVFSPSNLKPQLRDTMQHAAWWSIDPYMTTQHETATGYSSLYMVVAFVSDPSGASENNTTSGLRASRTIHPINTCEAIFCWEMLGANMPNWNKTQKSLLFMFGSCFKSKLIRDKHQWHLKFPFPSDWYMIFILNQYSLARLWGFHKMKPLDNNIQLGCSLRVHGTKVAHPKSKSSMCWRAGQPTFTS